MPGVTRGELKRVIEEAVDRRVSVRVQEVPVHGRVDVRLDAPWWWRRRRRWRRAQLSTAVYAARVTVPAHVLLTVRWG